MKVTALICDELITEVKQYSGGKNITESLTIALREWLSLKKIQELNNELANKPLEFSDGFSAFSTRELNRSV